MTAFCGVRISNKYTLLSVVCSLLSYGTVDCTVTTHTFSPWFHGDISGSVKRSTVADLRGAQGTRPPPPGVQILSISCSFWENSTNSYVGAPLGVGAPSSGKSWIRRWSRLFVRKFPYEGLHLYLERTQ